MNEKNRRFDSGAKDDLEGRLKAMNKRLGRDIKPEEGSRKPDSAGYGNAFRLSSEFISAILVGTAIGYGIDWLAGTLPWGMIVFMLLGFVAGVKNVLRAAGEMSGPYKSDETENPSDGKNET